MPGRSEGALFRFWCPKCDEVALYPKQNIRIDVKFADSSQLLRYANYTRAPRAGPDHLPEEYRCRFSFCCDRDPPKADRTRMPPPSVRFLGRKVYLGAGVIRVSGNGTLV
jgi:hypothetical protein